MTEAGITGWFQERSRVTSDAHPSRMMLPRLLSRRFVSECLLADWFSRVLPDPGGCVICEDVSHRIPEGRTTAEDRSQGPIAWNVGR